MINCSKIIWSSFLKKIKDFVTWQFIIHINTYSIFSNNVWVIKNLTKRSSVLLLRLSRYFKKT